MVVRLKTRLFEAPPPGMEHLIPPPVASQIVFAGNELDNGDSFSGCGLVEGAEVTVEFEEPLQITIQTAGGLKTAVKVRP